MYLIKPSIIHQNLFRNQNCLKAVDKIFVRSYIPRRAMLYVPGDSEEKITKAMNLKVDCIIMDCEDGVAVNRKSQARETIHSFLNKKSGNRFDWAVRINPAIGTLIEDDLRAILTAKHTPDTLVLPKIYGTEDLQKFSDMIQKQKYVGRPLNLILIIESAMAMLNLPIICQACLASKLFKLNGLIFGSDDLCASLGALRTDDSKEIIYARQKLVLVAKAFHLQAIDMVYINYKDLTGLKTECLNGMKMGYTGKQAIHPAQVPVVQEAFLPTKVQIAWASALIEAFIEYQKKGVGAFSYKNSMIDMPTLKIAQNMLDLVNKSQRH